MDQAPLSGLELIRIIAKYAPTSYAKFVDEIMQRDMLVPSIYKGWMGIDSKFCVILLYHATEHVKGRTIKLPSFDGSTTARIYLDLYMIYARACNDSKLPFTPCMKGLGTILNKRAEKSEH